MSSLFETTHDKAHFQEMDSNELITYIQPLWIKFNLGKGLKEMSKAEIANMETALEVYAERGLDYTYFTSGFGAPNSTAGCIIS